MKRLFGKCKSKEHNDEEEQDPKLLIARLRATEEMVQKKIAFLEKKIENQVAAALNHGRERNKRAALQALSRKKRYEKQIEQLDGILCTLELQREALENSTINREILGSMKSASRAMKAMNEADNVDAVHELMNSIREQCAVAEELSGAISQATSSSSSAESNDEDELMTELARLEQESQLTSDGERELQLPDAVRDPLPTGKQRESKDKKKGKKKEEDDLDKLAEWCA